uniref:U3 small nucleolar RNA-associated protein 18 homolog n=2 Tax=Lygus hesperus TaxID=30085 RepID=A0A0A9Y4N2_LYGHE
MEADEHGKSSNSEEDIDKGRNDRVKAKGNRVVKNRQPKRRNVVVAKIGSDSDDEDAVHLIRKRMKLLDDEREKLEKLVLGDASTLLSRLGEADRKVSHAEDSGVEEEAENDSEFSDTLGEERPPAWQDADDQDIVSVEDVLRLKKTRKVPLGLKPTSDYQKYLRKKFTDVHGEPSWAKLDQKHAETVDPDLAILRSSGHMLEKPKYLSKGVLEIKKMASLNSSTRNEGIIKAVQFHPTSTVALVAGMSGIASIFQVDGSGNNKLASVRFEKFPIRCARFSPNGKEFIVGSTQQRHFYCYDMMVGTSIKIPMHHNTGLSNMSKFEISPDGKFIAVAGKFGQIHLLTGNSKEWVGTFSMNGSVETLCFSPDSKTLYSYGEQGDVYVWNVGSRRLIHKFHDEGSIKGTSLAVSPCETYIAAGSSSGVVNLYETNRALQENNPVPSKAIMNLVTSSTSVVFNHSSQILAIASDEKENAVKLVHLPSFTVFSNFPSYSAELHRIQDVAFSPNSGYLSLVNNKQTAFLFRLKHFGNY